MGVMTGFAVDSLTPRSAKKAVIRGRIGSSRTCRELAVTMKSSAHLTSLMGWTRRCYAPACTTASSPSRTKLLTTGERLPPWGTPAVVGERAPWSLAPRRSPFDNTPLCMGLGASSHETAMLSKTPWGSPAKIQVAAVCWRRTVQHWASASAPWRLGRNPDALGSATVSALGCQACRLTPYGR